MAAIGQGGSELLGPHCALLLRPAAARGQVARRASDEDDKRRASAREKYYGSKDYGSARVGLQKDGLRVRRLQYHKCASEGIGRLGDGH